MTHVPLSYAQASIKTASMLRTVASTEIVRELSRLSLPEVDAVVQAVAEVIPAGNVPGVILNGLIHLPERQPPPAVVRRDLHLLFNGLEQFMDKAVYGAVFAGPAAVIWGYQNLLKLAGKDPDAAFPQGLWQFYVDYALREDTARHSNETTGFDDLLRAHRLKLARADRLAAWIMAAIYTLAQYPEFLACEWRERVYLALLGQAAAEEPALPAAVQTRLERVYPAWEARRPYGRSAEAAAQTYPASRRFVFERFLDETLAGLPEALIQRWRERTAGAEAEELPAYLEQMNILATLEPAPYGETHRALALQQAQIGVIAGNAYYLVPVLEAGGLNDVHAVRAWAAAILKAEAAAGPGPLAALARTQRAALPKVIEQLGPNARSSLAALAAAPILINADFQPRWRAGPGGPQLVPLSQVRQAERGIGSHPLTIFDTGESFIFDQSHIFFDGATGAAVAEIMTNEALSWAVYLHALAPAQPAASLPPLELALAPQAAAVLHSAPQVTVEAGAETEAVNLKALLRLRKLFKQRSDLLALTVNDLLVLYRSIHARTYQTPPALLAELQLLLSAGKPAARAAAAALSALTQPAPAPAVLIPVDASQRSPRDRLYPLNFEIPLADLRLLELHRQTLAALAAYLSARGEASLPFETFRGLQAEYLASLAGFGQVMSRAKAIALAGETASMGAIKMLAYLPVPLQRMLDAVPARLDLLNDVIKGREVFSNVGRVAPTSTLVRFITAKDDNDKKTLAWGVITDAAGVMRIALRDFRPHVGLLAQAGQAGLAQRITQAELEAFSEGLNRYTADLTRIVLSGRPQQAAPICPGEAV